MEQRTLDALNQLLITMQNVGIGMVMAVIVGLMVIAFILFTRRQSKADASTSKQFEQVIIMLAEALKREDSETAKAITPLVEIVGMAKISLEQNTQAFLQQNNYRAQVLDATLEMGRLQAETNARLTSWHEDFNKWPGTISAALDRVDVNILGVVNGFGSLQERIEKILKAVEDNPDDHRHVLEALTNLAQAQQKIFEIIDSRLPERAKADTPAFPTLPPAPSQVLIDTMRKRATDETPKIIPLDETPPKDSA